MPITPLVKLNIAGHGAKSVGLLAAVMAVAVLSAPPQATAKPKTANCRIESEGALKFNGPCRFLPERGGSFILNPARGRGPLYGTVLSVSVTIIKRGVAEVRGLTSAGINSRWGRAERSRKNPACWVGSDFKVCAK
jgi:hypothetical protein